MGILPFYGGILTLDWDTNCKLILIAITRVSTIGSTDDMAINQNNNQINTHDRPHR